MKFLKCSSCENIVEMVVEKVASNQDCEKGLKSLVANTSDGATEKHVPVMELVDGNLHVSVGSIDHPMSPEHYIMFIAIEAGNMKMRYDLKPNDSPKAVFALNDYKGKVEVFEYCNLHGLWKNEIEI